MIQQPLLEPMQKERKELRRSQLESIEQQKLSQCNFYGLSNNQVDVFYFLIYNMSFQSQDALFFIWTSEVVTIPSALELLITDQEGKYSHWFLQDQIGNCKICGTTQRKHHIVRNSHKILQKLQMIDINNKQQEGSFQCEICYEQVPMRKMMIYQKTKHPICMQCLKQYLTQQILISKVMDMKCPHCKKTLSQNFIKKIIDASTFEKFKKFLNNNRVAAQPLLRWCPNTKCGKMIKLKSVKDKKGNCNECKTQVCTLCNRQYHQGYSCDQILKQQMKMWQDSIDLQRCKKCKAMVQKVSGCNHMTCGYCGYQFCWLCGGTFYSYGHYNEFNPFGCPGLANEQSSRQNWSKGRIIALRIGLMLGFILLTPFLAIGIGPFLVIIWIQDRDCYYMSGCFFRMLLMISSVIIGIVANPIIWLVCIIGIIPFGIFHLYKYCQTRRQMQQYWQRVMKQKQELEDL